MLRSVPRDLGISSRIVGGWNAGGVSAHALSARAEVSLGEEGLRFYGAPQSLRAHYGTALGPARRFTCRSIGRQPK
jgi:hypothetical protein